MAQFRKKPVVIEAFRMGIDNMPDWFFDKVVTKDVTLLDQDERPLPDPENCNPFDHRKTGCEINTLEGVMRGDYGDYIIRGVKGEVCPCKPDIFTATYEPV